MHKIALVFANELITVMSRRSFLLLMFLVPLISVTAFIGASYLNRNEPDTVLTEMISTSERRVVEGYVDDSGIISALPPGEHGRLRPFASVIAGQRALERGEISHLYIIPEDYLERGVIHYMRPEERSLIDLPFSGAIRTALIYNLVEGDTTLAERISSPLEAVQTDYLTPEPERDPRSLMTFFLPYGVTFVFYITIFGTASLMLNSITDEKQNRVMEILMTSITPVQMLTGKVFALGLVGLLQTLLWGGTGFVLLRMGGRVFDLPAAFQLTPEVLGWGVVFFLLGYALYGILMAGVGALVPNLREASQVTIVLVIPLILPLMFINLLVQQPNGPVSVGLSLFPFTAPVAMMARLSAAAVPAWQPVVSAGLLVIAALVVIRSVSGMFRAQTLLSGQAFNLKLLVKALVGRA